MIIFLIYIYIILGLGFLLIPSIALELGRPRDLLKGGLLCLFAFFLFIQKNSFQNSDLIILIFNNIICFIFIAEAYLTRWNTLSDKERKSLKNISTIKSKLLLFLDALKMGNKDFFSKTSKVNLFPKNDGKRVWVRVEKSKLEQNNKTKHLNSVSKDLKATNLTKEDIIVDEN